MADDSQNPSDNPGFGDLFADVGDDTSFAWDDDVVEGTDDEEMRQVVSFRLNDDLFAIPADLVREILGDVEITDMPGAPDHVVGISVVRRQVVGLLSLRHFLDLASLAPTKADDDARATARVLLIDTAHYTVGLQVDEVMGLDEWSPSLLNRESLPANIRAKTRRYARGVRQQANTFCVFLDLESLLDDAAVQ